MRQNKIIRGMEQLSKEKSLRRICMVHPREEKALRCPNCNTWREPTREMDSSYLQEHLVAGKGGMATNRKKLDLEWILGRKP